LLVLAFDTSTQATCLGLFLADGSGGAEAIELRILVGLGGHSAILPPAVDEVLKARSLAPSDLDIVAAGRGPGSFTGLRTGLALAKGLALGAGKPVLGVPTLAVLAGAALSAAGDGPSLAAPLIDARHQEIFTALFRLNGDSPLPEPVSDTLVLSPELVMPTLKALAPDRDILLCGPALGLLPPAAPGFVPGDPAPPDPRVLAAQAAFLLSGGLKADCPATPLYGRSPDIFKKWVPPARLGGQPG
jgi:tRNA threonylcarbamoyladenosine biosynthesis protein TsaB